MCLTHDHICCLQTPSLSSLSFTPALAKHKSFLSSAKEGRVNTSIKVKVRIRSESFLPRQLFLLQAGPLASRSSRPPQLADWQPAASRRSEGMYFLLKSGAILRQEPLQTLRHTTHFLQLLHLEFCITHVEKLHEASQDRETT